LLRRKAIHQRPDRLSLDEKIQSETNHHADKDVVCHVIKGNGRLRIDGERFPLRPGTICHIPKGTPHDFAAGKSEDLILFFSLIKTH
jgi:mannose-6-phosphate isomerase-like protein (cupin superfamily)